MLMSGGAVSGTVSGNLVKALKNKFETGQFSSPDESQLIRSNRPPHPVSNNQTGFDDGEESEEEEEEDNYDNMLDDYQEKGNNSNSNRKR